MTTILDKRSKKPRTHAIVIGVGHYPYLIGGEPGKLIDQHEGMGQLESPSKSALAFTDWLIREYNNPAKPLASLQLLISKMNEQLTLPSGKVIPINNATMENIKKDIQKWFDKGDQNKDNLLIFYFCGHGIAKGSFTTLLAEDFGASKLNILENAIDFYQFHMGMERCKARQQIYFIDACRNVSSNLIDSVNTGQPIISGRYQPSKFGMRRAPILFSTIAGYPAFGRHNQPSIFTDAMLQSLKGAGSNKDAQKWNITTNSLHDGISTFLAKCTFREADELQTNLATDLTNFTLHEYKGNPSIPVTVECEPKEANGKADLAYSNNEVDWHNRQEKDPRYWFLSLEPGSYHFQAKFENNEFKDVNQEYVVFSKVCECVLEVRK